MLTDKPGRFVRFFIAFIPEITEVGTTITATGSFVRFNPVTEGLPGQSEFDY
jgi:hypothetical protein